MSAAKSFKRGAAHHNPVNTPLPEEYIVLVGGPTNTFNGYGYYDKVWQKALPVPHPGNLKNLNSYILSYQGQPTETHDLYWANFLDSATRLFTLGIARPKPGDIVTIVVFLRPYLWRQAADFEASPYNLVLHRNSPYVRKKVSLDHDPSVKSGLTGTPMAPAKFVPNERDAAREEVINHHILMQTTDGNTSEAVKRPENMHHYLDYLHDIPRKIVFGPLLAGEPRLPDVLVRLLLINDEFTFRNYLKTGAFAGRHWIHPLDKRSEEDMGAGARLDERGAFYDQALGVSGRSWAQRWRRILASHAPTPGVNRQKIKVKRFDYFGHAVAQGPVLYFGWGNRKGEHPFGPGFFELWDRTAGFPEPGSRAFARDASAWLWGCRLGRYYAPWLTSHFRDVTACEDLTDYSGILASPGAMPVPREGASWKRYDKESPRLEPPKKSFAAPLLDWESPRLR